MLFIKTISNVKITLSSEKNIVLSDTIYILAFICNLLNLSRLYTRQ